MSILYCPINWSISIFIWGTWIVCQTNQDFVKKSSAIFICNIRIVFQRGFMQTISMVPNNLVSVYLFGALRFSAKVGSEYFD